MSSHKKRKGSAAQTPGRPNGAARPAAVPRGATATTSAPIARTGATTNGTTATGTTTTARPATAAQTQDTAAAKRTATMPAPARTSAPGKSAPENAVVRRGAPVARKRTMTRYERERRRQRNITSAVVAVLVVGAVAWILATHWPFHGAAPRAAQGGCPTVAGTGINGSAAPSGGPAHITGTIVTANKQCLQYVDTKVGTGAAIKAGDTATVNYTGWLTNGTKFDSSLNPGRTPFQVTNVGNANVIQGWNEGLIGMKVGGTRRLIIPGALAYGAQGSSPTIPPNATLIFDITVVSIP